MLPLARFVVSKEGGVPARFEDVFRNGMEEFYRNAEAGGVRISPKEKLFLEQMVEGWLGAVCDRHVYIGRPLGEGEWEECYASFKHGDMKVKVMVIFKA